MPQMEKKTLSAPDEKRSFDKGQVELVSLGGVTFGRATLQPGWKWSTCVKPIVNTESCQAPHLQYHVSGRLRVRMDDGSEGVDCDWLQFYVSVRATTRLKGCDEAVPKRARTR
jgi:hypothetical protein